MSHDAVTTVSRRYRLQRESGKSIAFWGVILLSVTEGIMFLMLLFSYFYLWAQAEQWPPADVELPGLGFSSVRSVVLLSTSLTVWLAERALKRGNRRQVWLWMWVTVAGAGFFLWTHVLEFLRLPAEFTWYDHVYGSLYYTILNFHGAHVAVGMLIFAYLMVRLARGAFGPDDLTQFEIGSIYWHFVDGVWVFVFASLYLAPNLLAGGG